MVLLLMACGKPAEVLPISPPSAFISALDLSRYPEIAQSGAVFYDQNGQASDLLTIVKTAGVNTVRLRLWVNPPEGHSGLAEVKAFAQILRSTGFKLWLTLHYSDTWADPGQQVLPAEWQNLSLEALQTQIATYTQMVVEQLRPEIIQIGNEINAGFLHPHGHLIQHPAQFLSLMGAAIRAVRSKAPDTAIMLHFAGLENSDWFFSQVASLDYDLIGLSYYPLWHGKDLTALKNQLALLSAQFGKEVLIAETAYPFTLAWNDWTNNIVGQNEQLILPDYPASPTGQRDFMLRIKSISQETSGGRGFCYWGGELIAWQGPQATQASPWENQALFDFENRALPALYAFRPE
ncbi:MAG: hypothetical protein OHK0053_20170 [Microscillaceae bacterium]